MEIKLDLTEREADILDDYIFRKIIRLEENGLTDAECYKLFQKVHRELTKKDR